MRENIPVEITQPMAEVWNTVSRIPEIQTATCRCYNMQQVARALL